MEVIEKITIEEIRQAKPKTIYYAVHTCWWTHDPTHLSKTPDSYGLPCDPRGSVLMMTDDVEGFLKAAENSSFHYGKHGLRAFMASHHLNCIESLISMRPWCEPTWQEYNNAIDRLDIRKSRLKTAGPSSGISD